MAPSRTFFSVALAPAIAFALVAAEPARVQQPPALSEELQVTSVDLWVAAGRDGAGSWLRGDGALPKLDPADFELRVDGRAVAIAGIAAAAAEPAPRRIVAFLDAVTSDQASFRWAASRLAERATELVALGEVEVVVADPEPRVVMAATRDAERLTQALAGLALFAGTDAAIPLLRDQFLVEAESAEAEDNDLAARFVEEETALVLHQQDVLLRHLIDREPATRAGRVLLYASQGFDPRPEGFYVDAGAPEAVGTEAPKGRLEAESRAWVRAVAAHGWTCLSLVYEDRRALLRRGFRIGKWRFHRPGAGMASGSGAPMLQVGASYEGERDAETAAALVELGDGALARGDHAAAVDAYLRAIHRFYGDSRTSERQAYAWRQLAVALRGSGEIDRARWAMANALELDPSLASLADDGLTDVASLTHDVEGLGELARETGGTLLRDGKSLALALEALARRQRFTFTLAGAATGRVLSLELSWARGAELEYGRWTRSGTPERLAAARLRLLLHESAAEPADDGDLAALSVAEGEPGESAGVTIALARPSPARATRVLVGVLGEEGFERTAALTAVDPSSAAPPAGAGTAPKSIRWQGRIDLDDGDTQAAAVYVEDLASGEWTVEPVTIEPGEASASDAR